MTANPYAPPQAGSTSASSPSDIRLFGPRAIAAHAVLFTPLVGAILAAINQRRLGKAAAFRRTLLMFVAPSAVLVVVVLAASERVSGLLRLVTFAWSISVARMLHQEHQVLVQRHIEAGGKRARWYLATLAALGVVLLAVLAVVAVEMATGSGPAE